MMAKNILQACWDQAVDIDNPRLVIMLVSEPHIIQLDSEQRHAFLRGLLAEVGLCV
jgi:hypothetical protein